MGTPVSVLLPDDLRRRVQRVATKRTVGLSTALRLLVEERLAELEAQVDLRAAEEWQQDQAWATYVDFERDGGEVSWDELQERIDRAVAGGVSPSPKRSHATSKRSSAGSPRKTSARGRSA